MVVFYFANFMLIVDLHPWWLCRDLRRRIFLGFLICVGVSTLDGGASIYGVTGISGAR